MKVIEQTKIPKWAALLSKRIKSYRPKFAVGDIVMVADPTIKGIGVVIKCAQDAFEGEQKYWERPHYSINFKHSTSSWHWESSMTLLKTAAL